MKTFLSNLIPRLQKFSKNLDNTSSLTTAKWILLNEEAEKKVVYIFSDDENTLRISENGKIKKGKWLYLGDNYIELEVDNELMLFKHALLDEQILALKRDGTEEYALLIKETSYDNYLNTVHKLNSFLEERYLPSTTSGLPNTRHQNSNFTIDQHQKFDPSDFPSFKLELNKLRTKMQEYPKQNAVDIITSFAKDHSLKNEWYVNNPNLCKDVANQEIRLKEIENIFSRSKTNPDFQQDLQNYLQAELP